MVYAAVAIHFTRESFHAISAGGPQGTFSGFDEAPSKCFFVHTKNRPRVCSRFKVVKPPWKKYPHPFLGSHQQFLLFCNFFYAVFKLENSTKLKVDALGNYTQAFQIFVRSCESYFILRWGAYQNTSFAGESFTGENDFFCCNFSVCLMAIPWIWGDPYCRCLPNGHTMNLRRPLLQMFA